jgi:hypothetical protein
MKLQQSLLIDQQNRQKMEEEMAKKREENIKRLKLGNIII